MKLNPYKSKKIRKNKRSTAFFRSQLSGSERPVFVSSYVKKTRKVWLIPLIATLLILFTVFWLGPRVADIISQRVPGADPVNSQPELLYDSSNYTVVSAAFTDLLKEPDIRASRLSQILYNDPLKILSRSGAEFLYVELSDGAKGYVMTRDVISDTSSIEPGKYLHKLTVASRTKRIMSHASQGSLLKEVVMGTVLFSDYGSGGLYRVALVGGGNGWISSEGVVRTETDSDPQLSSSVKFYETALLFANSTFINNGCTVYGASSQGISFISAKVNGVDLPRDLLSQSISGSEVKYSLDSETGSILFNDLKEGDLVFFGTDYEDEGIKNMGIVVGYGRVLMSVSGRNSVRIVDLTSDTALTDNIIAVRRLFPS